MRAYLRGGGLRILATAPVPAVDFTAIVEGDRIVCTNQTTAVRDEEISGYSWVLKKLGVAVGDPITTEDAIFTVTESGTYTVELTITTSQIVVKGVSTALDVEIEVPDVTPPANLANITITATYPTLSVCRIDYDQHADADSDLSDILLIIGTSATVVESGAIFQTTIPASQAKDADAADRRFEFPTTSLTPSTTYKLRTIARDFNGNPNATDLADTTKYTTAVDLVMPAATAPLPGAFTVASATALSATLIRVVTNDSSDATAYTFKRRLSGTSDPFLAIGETLDPVLTFDDVSCSPETGYEYQVRAVNATGTTDSSNTKSATTPAQGAWPNNEPAHSLVNAVTVLNFRPTADPNCKYFGFPPPANPGAASYSPVGSNWTFGVAWQRDSSSPLDYNDVIADPAAPYGYALRHHCPVGAPAQYNGNASYKIGTNPPQYHTFYERFVFKLSTHFDYEAGGSKMPGYFGALVGGTNSDTMYLLARETGGSDTQGILKWLHIQGPHGAHSNSFYHPSPSITISHDVYHTIEYYYIRQSALGAEDATILVYWDDQLLTMARPTDGHTLEDISIYASPDAASKLYCGHVQGPWFHGGSNAWVTESNVDIGEWFIRCSLVRP